jgi:hypothetical protein
MREFKARVCGIPCVIRVTYWEPYQPAIIRADPGDSHPPEGGDGEWEILDSRGRPAPWLQSKLDKDPDEQDRVSGLVYNYMENERYDDDY